MVAEYFAASPSSMLPDSMKALPDWLLFRVTYNAAKAKYVKDPLQARRKAKAACDDPTTWTTHREAVAALQRTQSGHTLGFALPEDRSITLIDLDHARDPQTGEIAEWAQPILLRFAGTYTEISVSGEGFHILLLGTIPYAKGRKKDGIEISSGGPKDESGHGAGRMVAITGNRYNGAPAQLAPMQSELNALCAEMFPAKKTAARPQVLHTPLAMDDATRWMHARNNPDKRKAERFQRLHDRGDCTGYRSRSEAHLALANEYAYYCGPGADSRIDDLLAAWGEQFDDSGKMDRADYRANLVTRAYDGRTAFFQPRTSPVAIPHQIEKESDPPPAQSDELAKALARIAELEAEVKTLRAANCALNARLEWEREVKTVPNKIVGASTRETAALLRRDLERTQASDDDGFNRRPEEDGFWRMDTTTLAKRYGVSSSTLSKSIRELETVGAVEVKNWDVETSKGPRPRIAVKLAPKILTPKEWVRADGTQRDIGGDRKTCKKCGAMAVTERHGVLTLERPFVETHCPDCGTTHREYIGDAVEKGKRYFAGSAIPHQIEKESESTEVEPREIQQRGSNQIVQDFSLPDIPEPPKRDCIPCRTYDWRWDGERWYCGSCQPRAEVS